MPRITVEWLEGRSKEQRQKIVDDITNSFVKNINLRPKQITIVFKENSPEMQYKGGESYKSINSA